MEISYAKELEGYPDQWAYLSAMQKLSAENVDALIRAHSHGDALGNLCVVESTSKPWEKQRKVTLSALDFYGVQHIVRANMIYIPSNGFAPRVRNQLLRLAAFRNPDFYKSQAMRLPIYDKPRIICAAEERDGYLALPRCCEPDLTELLETAGASYEIEDKTFGGNEIQTTFKGELRPEQIPAAEPKVYQRYTVIDNSILWYGGINFLGFEKAAHGVMRLCSIELASELTSYMNTQTKYEQLEMY